MARKQKKYHYIYKTTNVINGRYYIGMHSTDDLDDGYMGSGKRLWNSMNYHGKENHKVEILEFCNNRGELKKREEEIVNEQLLTEDLCMNLTTGGQGGAQPPEKQRKWIMAGSAGFVKKLREDAEFREVHRKTVSENMKKYHATGKHNYNTFEGKTHSEETKKKMSESSKGMGKGKANSQYGTCWITRDGENKKIKKTNYDK
jgi:hypothetical protein